jgi:hypothetical protein
MSTIKVNTLTTLNGSGNITVSRPLSGSGASLTDLPAANLTGTLPALDGSNLTGVAPTQATIEALGIELPAANLTGTVATARLGSGTASSSTFLRGDQTYAAAGGGKVLQVVYGSTSTEVHMNSSSTWVDTGLSATITPSATSSKVLILVSQNGVSKGAHSGAGVKISLLRGASVIQYLEYHLASTTATSANLTVSATGTNLLDSPNTTSATTYKTQFIHYNANHSIYTQYLGAQSTISLLEIGA